MNLVYLGKMIDPTDWNYVPTDPSPNFSEKRNKRIIAETIEDNEKLRKKREKEYGSKIRERSEAMARYLDDVVKGKTSSDVDKYFGNKELAKLRGEEIRDIIKAKISDDTKNRAIQKAKRAG